MMPRRALAAPRVVGRWTLPLPLVGIAAGWLIGSLLAGLGHEGQHSSVRIMNLALVGLVLVLMIIRRRQLASARLTRGGGEIPREVEMPPVPATKAADPGAGSDLERGVRDIRRTDPGFDATRFSGYTGMMFRDAHTAWMTRDIASLRARVTPEIYAGLQAQCERLLGGRRSNRVKEIEIRAEVTEAWQERDRDYVTAYIAGSMIDYTIDDASEGLVAGSRTERREVEEFWTFTRPAGLNFWMLSAIQPS